MEFISIELGKRLPMQDVLDKILGSQGASLNYNKEAKRLDLYVVLDNPRNREINAFRKDMIRFALYRNHLLNTSIILLHVGTELIFDLVFDINTLDMDMDGRIESNMFNMFLIDSKTGIVCGMRSIGLGEKLMSELNQITKNDGRYTSAEYNNWLENDVFKKSLNQLWYSSESIAWDE